MAPSLQALQALGYSAPSAAPDDELDSGEMALRLTRLSRLLLEDLDCLGQAA